jgi:hypothetical protein
MKRVLTRPDTFSCSPSSTPFPFLFPFPFLAFPFLRSRGSTRGLPNPITDYVARPGTFYVDSDHFLQSLSRRQCRHRGHCQKCRSDHWRSTEVLCVRDGRHAQNDTGAPISPFGGAFGLGQKRVSSRLPSRNTRRGHLTDYNHRKKRTPDTRPKHLGFPRFVLFDNHPRVSHIRGSTQLGTPRGKMDFELSQRKSPNSVAETPKAANSPGRRT